MHHWRRLRGGGGWHGLAARRFVAALLDCRAKALCVWIGLVEVAAALSFSTTWWWNLW